MLSGAWKVQRWGHREALDRTVHILAAFNAGVTARKTLHTYEPPMYSYDPGDAERFAQWKLLTAALPTCHAGFKDHPFVRLVKEVNRAEAFAMTGRYGEAMKTYAAAGNYVSRYRDRPFGQFTAGTIATASAFLHERAGDMGMESIASIAEAAEQFLQAAEWYAKGSDERRLAWTHRVLLKAALALNVSGRHDQSGDVYMQLGEFLKARGEYGIHVSRLQKALRKEEVPRFIEKYAEASLAAGDYWSLAEWYTRHGMDREAYEAYRMTAREETDRGHYHDAGHARKQQLRLADRLSILTPLERIDVAYESLADFETGGISNPWDISPARVRLADAFEAAGFHAFAFHELFVAALAFEALRQNTGALRSRMTLLRVGMDEHQVAAEARHPDVAERYRFLLEADDVMRTGLLTYLDHEYCIREDAHVADRYLAAYFHLERAGELYRRVGMATRVEGVARRQKWLRSQLSDEEIAAARSGSSTPPQSLPPAALPSGSVGPISGPGGVATIGVVGGTAAYFAFPMPPLLLAPSVPMGL